MWYILEKPFPSNVYPSRFDYQFGAGSVVGSTHDTFLRLLTIATGVNGVTNCIKAGATDLVNESRYQPSWEGEGGKLYTPDKNR